MRKLKIIQLLGSFSKEELDEFVYFAENAYFRKDRNYNDILGGIIKILKDGKNINEMPAGKFYDKILGGRNVNNQTIRNRINELTKIAERYIIDKEMGADYNLSKLLLMRGYMRRKLNKQFLGEYTDLMKTISDTTDKSDIISQILELKVMFSKENRSFDEMFADFNSQIEYIIAYFLESLFNSTKEYEIEKKYGVNPSIKILEALTDSLKSEKLIKFIEEQNNPFYRRILINYYQYKSLANLNDLTWLNKLEKLFYDKMEELNDDLKNYIMTHMISYYFYKINAGETKYLSNVFKLYKLKLSLGLHSELKEIRYPSSAFRDYVVVGIRLKQYKWVEKFIAEYSGELPAEIRDEEKFMAYSRLYFGKKDFDKSLEMSGKINSNNPLYFLDASRNKLRIYYEQVKFEEAFLEIDRKKHYLKNNAARIAKPVIQYSKEFIDVYSKLLKFRLSPNKKELGYFMKSVLDSGTLPLKIWFIEKIKELSKTFN